MRARLFVDRRWREIKIEEPLPDMLMVPFFEGWDGHDAIFVQAEVHLLAVEHDLAVYA